MIPIYAEEGYIRKAEELSAELQTDILSEAPKEELYLCIDEDGVSLKEGKMVLRGDFSRLLNRISPAHIQHEKLLRAARLKDVREGKAVDATAGLGEDSFILAAGGYHVLLCEYNPLIYILLKDTWERALKDPSVSDIAQRMEVRRGDGAKILTELDYEPDLVYLDPMFPAKKKSGISTKKLQLFQRFEAPCSKEEELLDAAFTASPRKIVVKRPMKGDPLAMRRPSHSIEGRNIRFDCYVLR